MRHILQNVDIWNVTLREQLRRSGPDNDDAGLNDVTYVYSVK